MSLTPWFIGCCRRLVVEEHLSAEMAFFWRYLIVFLHDKQSDMLERITPTIADYETYLRR